MKAKLFTLLNKWNARINRALECDTYEGES